MFEFILGGLGGKIGKWDSAIIDNHVFRLHYRATFLICSAAALLVTSKQYIGDPIDCMADSINGGIADVYCWISSTFSVPKRVGGVQGVDNAHPGVAPLDDEPVIHHKYYQWVVFVLTLQAILFYIPRLVWKSCEGGLMKILTGSLNDVTAFLDRGNRQDGVETIRKFYGVWEHRSGYFLKFVLCELLNFVNVLGQIYFTDRFLGYQFTSYGLEVVNQSEADMTLRGDEMNKVFPKISKCTFHKYGPTGTIEKHDVLCVLPLNIINEKIYVFLWFWLVFLASLTATWLIYRVFTILSSDLRVSIIHSRAGGIVGKDKIIAAISNKDHTLSQQLGNYLLLYFITKNLSPIIVKDVFEAIVPDSNHIEDQSKSA